MPVLGLMGQGRHRHLCRSCKQECPLAGRTLAAAERSLPPPQLWLKRRTSQNMVIGGAAGAIPPLAGWAAAHGRLGLGAGCLFLIVLLWTPPHFWALALLLTRQYRAAGVPMLPVARGVAATTRQVLSYTLALVAASLLPGLTGTFGGLYLAAAVVLDGILCVLAWRLQRESTAARAAVLFHYSLLYLALLFVAVAADSAIH